jgi:hypothetical protein
MILKQSEHGHTFKTTTKQLTQMDFIDDSYEAPIVGGNYAKLQDGNNKFRILSKPILGWVAWVNGKPVRYTYKNKPEGTFDQGKPARHFWAMIVWNYQEKAVQVLEITQYMIQQAILSLSRSDDWGNVYEYDIVITKTGKEKNTKYTIQPAKPKPLEEDIKKSALDKPIYLDAMFTGADPFAVTDKSTELAFLGLPF